MIQEEYVSFETAQMLKEAGFEYNGEYFYDKHGNVEPGLYAEDDNYPRPTQSFAARWIREVHGLHVYAKITYNYIMNKYPWGYWVQRVSCDTIIDFDTEFDSPESAMEAGILFSLKLIINKQKKNK